MLDSDKFRKFLEKMSDIADLDDDFNDHISQYLNMTRGEYIKYKINDLIEEYRNTPDELLNVKIVDAIKTAMDEAT